MTRHSRGDSRGLADEQSALHRVARLVAAEGNPRTVFALVTREASRVLGVKILTLVKFEPDGTATVMAASSDGPFAVGARLTLDGPSVIARIRATGRAARVESYEGLSGAVAARLRSAGARAGYGAPIAVDGRVWGAMAAIETAQVLHEDAEHRLANFTDLVAIAIANAQTKDDLGRLASEQASLRRVATLVARGATGESFFALVAQEVQTLFSVPYVAIVRYDQREVVVVGAAGGHPFIPVGGRFSLDGPSVVAQVLDTGRPARMDRYRGLNGSVAGVAQQAGFQSVAGAPITADRRVWGAIVVVSTSDPLPELAGVRVAEYTELVATAISNAATHAELLASRARIVAASDEARRRIERDLHDGIQQRLIALMLDVQTLRARFTEQPQSGSEALRRLESELAAVLEEVQQISRGLHPALLARRGLRASLAAITRRSPIPVQLTVSGPRLPAAVEMASYYAVCEALTNAIKHSHASVIAITITTTPDSLLAVVHDDGVGGAQAGTGSGLTGLLDRVQALGGTVTVDSASQAGTRVEFTLPSNHSPT